jgi:hypothetical protein
LILLLLPKGAEVKVEQPKAIEKENKPLFLF